MIIWKYKVDDLLGGVSLRRGATFLSVQTQHGAPVAWFRCDPTADKEARRFVVRPTGQEYHACREQYLGTFQLQNGLLVFHLFELL
jgi:hypothetical protein